MIKPTTLDEALDLAHDGLLLGEYLRARLVQLTTAENSVAVKAIELLLSMPSETADVDFADVPTSVLLDYRNRASEFIKRQAVGAGDTLAD